MSCFEQTDRNFQHVVIDNGSCDREISRILATYQELTGNVTLLTSETPLGIAGGTQRALAAATGEYVAFLDHDDELTTDAVATCSEFLESHPLTDVVYSDWEHIDVRGRVLGSFRKPVWSPERLRGNMYPIHLLVIRRSLVQAVGGVRDEFEGSQDHDLMLRVSEMNPRVSNIPRVLYRWRAAPGSVMDDPQAKPYATENGRRAIEEHCARKGIITEVRGTATPGFYQHHRKPRARHVLSMVLPLSDEPRRASATAKAPALGSIINLADRLTQEHAGPEYELVCVTSPGRNDSGLKAALHEIDVASQVVEAPASGQGRYAKLNLAAAQASGDMLLFLDENWRVPSLSDLEHLMGIAEQEDVGAVGPLLLSGNGKIWQAGISFGRTGPVSTYQGERVGNQGMGDLLLDHEVSGVGSQCLLQRRQIWEKLGGFTESFTDWYGDVDYSLRTRESGLRIVLSPSTVVVATKVTRSSRRLQEIDRKLLQHRWGDVLLRDPFVRERARQPLRPRIARIAQRASHHLRQLRQPSNRT